MSSEKRKPKKAKVVVPKDGLCALLGVHGTYAKAHLIPRALTAPDTPGERFIEAGRGIRPIRRFSSWYDHQLVSTAGESILSQIDTHGIAELRKQRLVWSGFNGKKKLHPNDYFTQPDPATGIGIRNLQQIDGRKVRLFLLSILWRSLKTKIKEFSYLENIGVDLDLLGKHLVDGDSGAADYLPIVISQISTVGFTHNHSPTIQEMEWPDANGVATSRQFYRFYMQGLIAHVYPESCRDIFETAKAAFVGGADDLLVITHKFENSRQFEEAKSTMIESIQGR